MYTLNRILAAAALAVPLVFGLGWSPAVQAQVYTFGCITANDETGTDCDAAEAQLRLTLTGNASHVLFTFSNVGLVASSITDIYFGSGLNTSLTGASIINGSGVSFSFGASPGSLPAGGAYSFSTETDADSNRPTQRNGVNPGETVSFNFLSSYSATVAAMNTFAYNTVVGIHVQGFANRESEALVTTAIPEPETYALMLAGLGAIAFMARRRRQR